MKLQARIQLQPEKQGINIASGVPHYNKYQSDIDPAHGDDAAAHRIPGKDDSPSRNLLDPKVGCSDLLSLEFQTLIELNLSHISGDASVLGPLCADEHRPSSRFA